MARTSVGLDIGTRTVHVAEVATRGTPVVTNFGGVSLPEHAVREGEIIDADAVGASIRALVDAARLKDKNVRLGVANQRVVVRQIDLPWMEEAELRSSLPFQVQEYIPIPVEEAELDYHVLEDFEGEDGGRVLRVLLVAAHKDMVANHLAAVEAAGLKPVSIDLNPFAILRTVAHSSVIADRPEVVVDVGAGVTDIMVHRGGVPQFVRILVLGGNDITDAVASGMGLSREDAEHIKHSTDANGFGPEPTAGRIVEQHARQFVDEVRGSLDYYRTQVDSTQQLERVVLTGGGALLAGLADRLAAATHLPVDVASPFDRFQAKGSTYGSDGLRQVGPTLATAVGLALGGAA